MNEWEGLGRCKLLGDISSQVLLWPRQALHSACEVDVLHVHPEDAGIDDGVEVILALGVIGDASPPQLSPRNTGLDRGNFKHPAPEDYTKFFRRQSCC